VTTAITCFQPPPIIKLLSHKLRWQLVSALANSDLKVQELVQQLDQPQNLVSYHLKKLRAGKLVIERRSIADGREIYYSLDLDQMRASYLSAGESLHPALGGENMPLDEEAEEDSSQAIRVLFLCTHNSARSQIAEAILRSRSAGKIEVYSAGTEATRFHPMAIQALSELHIQAEGQFSKSLDRYLGQKFDYIITVCDRARESCPVFPGDPVRIHWSFPDPSAVEGSEDVRYAAFKETTVQMMARISYLMIMIERQHGINLDKNPNNK
jgi:protein-tyrosine-phosphatase/DNA-binding transcriptional ArsR family regulator